MSEFPIMACLNSRKCTLQQRGAVAYGQSTVMITLSQWAAFAFLVEEAFQRPELGFITFSGFTDASHCLASSLVQVLLGILWEMLMWTAGKWALHWCVLFLKGVFTGHCSGHSWGLGTQFLSNSESVWNPVRMPVQPPRFLYRQRTTILGCVKIRMLLKANGWMQRSCFCLLRNHKIR